jgi:Spy/CpxP family protein refolding chaperone
MKKQLINFLGAGALAAGMAFAQAPSATSAATAPEPGTSSSVTQGTHRQMMQKRIDRLTRELSLTPSQQSQAKSIFGKASVDARPVRAQLKQNTSALRAAVKANDRGQIDQLSATEGNLIGKMVAIRSEANASFYKTLSPEQQTKFTQLQQQARARWHSRIENQLHPNG